MQLLTFNTWHGLGAIGILKMAELEPAAVRAERIRRQHQQLEQSGADIFFLQEVNPLFPRLEQLCEQLGRYHFVGQNDLTGLKVFGYGLPMNLNSGLGIVAHADLNLHKKLGLKLSGGPGFASEDLSWEIVESRYALFAEVTYNQQKLLLVNAHLHHGQEPHPALSANLQKLLEQKKISAQQLAEVELVLEQSRLRRVYEVKKILSQIAELQSSYAGVIVGGDFNCDPGKDVTTLFNERGFTDVVQSSGQPLYSFDREHNSEIFNINLDFKLPVPDFGITALRDVLKAHNFRKTRLDYIFVCKKLLPKVKNVGLWGNFSPSTLNTSDHFGIKLELA